MMDSQLRRSDSHEQHDPFHVDATDDDDQLRKRYFQLRRGIRYLDNDFRIEQVNFKKGETRERFVLAHLQQEYEGFQNNVNHQADKSTITKRHQDGIKMADMYLADKLAKVEEENLQQQLKETLAFKDKFRLDLVKQKKGLGKKIPEIVRLGLLQNRNRRISDRIECSRTSLGKLLIKNAQLRENIETLRWHYKSFKALNDRLARELEHLKDVIRREIYLAFQDGDTRKSIGQSLAVLLMRKAHDQRVHQADIRDTATNLCFYKKLHAFLISKMDTRYEQYYHELTVNQRVDENQFMANEDKTIATYDDALKFIKELTNLDDVDLICNKFSSQEKDVYRKALYVNDLDEELIRMEKEVQTTIEAIRQETQSHDERKGFHENFLRLGDETSKQISISVEEMLEKSAIYGKKISEIKVEIDGMLKILQMDQELFSEDIVKPKFNHRGVIDYLAMMGDYCTAAVMQFECYRLEQVGHLSIVAASQMAHYKKRNTMLSGKKFELHVQPPAASRSWSNLLNMVQDFQHPAPQQRMREKLVYKTEHLHKRAEAALDGREEKDSDDQSTGGTSIYKKVAKKFKQTKKLNSSI